MYLYLLLVVRFSSTYRVITSKNILGRRASPNGFFDVLFLENMFEDEAPPQKHLNYFPLPFNRIWSCTLSASKRITIFFIPSSKSISSSC
ncbi:unnamed protein product [Moneuplotes crassus]|uniref:Uncharacterized protein n=1 Tax=Euplotes crassus TaxID=5936 RepID=A0AAD2D7A9_EUPCR|nr:unnamed protein product [Moneuplotes crassus]